MWLGKSNTTTLASKKSTDREIDRFRQNSNVAFDGDVNKTHQRVRAPPRIASGTRRGSSRHKHI